MSRGKFTTETTPTLKLAECIRSDAARAQQAQMNVGETELQAAVEAPEEAFYSDKHNAWTFREGRIAVGVIPNGLGGFPYITAVLKRRPSAKPTPQSAVADLPASAAA